MRTHTEKFHSVFGRIPPIGRKANPSTKHRKFLACFGENMYIFLYILFSIMLTTTLTDFRKDIKRYLDRVTENFETLIINRGKDRGIVVISLEEYNSLCATQHELSSRANERRLDAAIEKLKSGNSSVRKLADEA